MELERNRRNIIGIGTIQTTQTHRIVDVQITNVFVPALHHYNIYTIICHSLGPFGSRFEDETMGLSVGHSGSGWFSSIHLLGRFAIVTRGPTPTTPSRSSSANRFLLGRAGHGKMLDADTVKTVARKVMPKSDETNARRCMNRRALYVGILQLSKFQKADT